MSKAATGVAQEPACQYAESAHLQLYSVFRSYVENENELTNHRLTWNFAIQGFLFGSYALCVSKIADVSISLKGVKPADDDFVMLHEAIIQLQVAIQYISWAGALVSAFVLFAAVAAQIASWNVRKKWHKDHPEYAAKKDKTINSELPDLLGGGSLLAHFLGMTAPILLPGLFIVIWLLLLVGVARP